MVHTYPLKTKDEFTTAFEDVCLKYRNAGHPIERFMTDSDSVMRGREFRAAAHALSVECRYSSPYNQWQNGIVERMIKQIMERVLALLNRSRLPNDFWYSAVAYAAHTINGTPTQVNPKSASPRNVWRGNLRRCDDH